MPNSTSFLIKVSIVCLLTVKLAVWLGPHEIVLL